MSKCIGEGDVILILTTTAIRGVLRIKPGSSVRATSTLNHGAISPTPQTYIPKWSSCQIIPQTDKTSSNSKHPIIKTRYKYLKTIATRARFIKPKRPPTCSKSFPQTAEGSEWHAERMTVTFNTMTACRVVLSRLCHLSDLQPSLPTYNGSSDYSWSFGKKRKRKKKAVPSLNINSVFLILLL